MMYQSLKILSKEQTADELRKNPGYWNVLSLVSYDSSEKQNSSLTNEYRAIYMDDIQPYDDKTNEGYLENGEMKFRRLPWYKRWFSRKWKVNTEPVKPIETIIEEYIGTTDVCWVSCR